MRTCVWGGESIYKVRCQSVTFQYGARWNHGVGDILRQAVPGTGGASTVNY